MTKWVLQTFVVLCCVRVSLVRAAKRPQATCEPGKTTVTDVSGLTELRLHCPENYHIFPAFKQPPVVFSSDGNNPKEVNLTDHLPGANLGNAREAPGSMQLDVRQLPNTPTSLFFQCRRQDDDRENACFIHVRVAAGSPLGPNTCAAQNSFINLQLKKNGDVALFSCGDGLKLNPTGGQVFDSSCTKPMSIPEGLALTQDNVTYKFSLTSAQQPAKLCFACLYGDNTQMNRCEVRIEVLPEQKSVGRRDLSLSAGTAAAFCLAIASVSFLHGS